MAHRAQRPVARFARSHTSSLPPSPFPVAMIGHESFGAPSTGGHDHWLHHQLVDCNYGGTFVPIDWFFGSFVKDEDDFMKQRTGDGVKGE